MDIERDIESQTSITNNDVRIRRFKLGIYCMYCLIISTILGLGYIYIRIKLDN